MALFGRKKKQAPVQPQPSSGYTPVTPQPTAPGQMSAPKGTLAQNLGLDQDVTKLPPLPNVSRRDSALGKGSDLPPMPPMPPAGGASKLGDLPPLPADLPPLGSSDVATATPKAPKMKAPVQEQAPVFIRLDKYQDILDTVNQMESRINNLQNAIKKIGDIKAKEKDIIDTWMSLLTEAKQKVANVNSKLPEAK